MLRSVFKITWFENRRDYDNMEKFQETAEILREGLWKNFSQSTNCYFQRYSNSRR